MKAAFVVMGYGVPEDILVDAQYQTYLRTVLNEIYDFSFRFGVEGSQVILPGGNTDCFEPFDRTEAGEMKRYFEHLSKDDFVAQIISQWTIVLEERSLSSVENFVFSKELLDSDVEHVVIFSDATREKRNAAIAQIVFDQPTTVIPVNFDVSASRYVGHNFIQKKEAAALKHALWALESEENAKKHHELLEEKIRRLREAGPEKHQEAIKEWWKEAIEKAEEVK